MFTSPPNNLSFLSGDVCETRNHTLKLLCLCKINAGNSLMKLTSGQPISCLSTYLTLPWQLFKPNSGKVVFTVIFYFTCAY